jgi:hypothetical protein
MGKPPRPPEHEADGVVDGSQHARYGAKHRNAKALETAATGGCWVLTGVGT